jgi:hypothetical protein
MVSGMVQQMIVQIHSCQIVIQLQQFYVNHVVKRYSLRSTRKSISQPTCNINPTLPVHITRAMSPIFVSKGDTAMTLNTLFGNEVTAL